MVSEVLLYIGSVAITLRGIAQIVPTKSAVSGFGPISGDNKRIITVEWIAEGLTLCFIGLCTAYHHLERNSKPSFFYCQASAIMLIIMAGLSLLTGAVAGKY